MKAQTLAKRTIVPHEETRLTMKHAPQKLVPFFTKPRVIHKCLKIDSENLLQSPNPSYEKITNEGRAIYMSSLPNTRFMYPP